MSRNDGFRFVKRQIQRLAITEQNLDKAERYLEEHAAELTPDDLLRLRTDIYNKKKTLSENVGTFKDM